VTTQDNQEKRDANPYEYFGSSDESHAWVSYKSFILSLKISGRKKHNLLKKNLTHDSEQTLKSFVERDLNDTRYIGKALQNHIADNLDFAPAKKKRRVYVFTGQLTSLLRRRFGLGKNRDESNRHHALDAVVVGVANQSFVKRIADYAKKRETYRDELDSERFPEPWNDFRLDVLTRVFSDDLSPIYESEALNELYADCVDSLKPIFVSWAPNRSASGPFHKETIYSAKNYNQTGMLIKKKALTSLSAKDLDNLYGNDPKLHAQIIERMTLHNNDAKNAFADPLYKYSTKGQGSEVKYVKVSEVAGTYVPVLNGTGAAMNGSMIRVDIFKKGAKNFIVPVYIYDLVMKKLPNKAIVSGKPESKWLEMTEEYTFLFSIYPHDLVKIVNDGEIYYKYYTKCQRVGGALVLAQHDQPINTKVTGIKSVDSIDKVVVSPIGDLSLINQEKRQWPSEQ